MKCYSKEILQPSCADGENCWLTGMPSSGIKNAAITGIMTSQYLRACTRHVMVSGSILTIAGRRKHICRGGCQKKHITKIPLMPLASYKEEIYSSARTSSGQFQSSVSCTHRPLLQYTTAIIDNFQTTGTWCRRQPYRIKGRNRKTCVKQNPVHGWRRLSAGKCSDSMSSAPISCLIFSLLSLSENASQQQPGIW